MRRYLLTLSAILILHNIHFAQNTFYGDYSTPGGLLSKQLSDGNFICAGTWFNLFVMKIDPQGQILWQYQTSFGGGVGFQEVEEMVDGSLIFLVGTPPPASTYMFKLDSGGNLLWSYHYSTTANTQHTGIEPMPDSGFIMIANGFNPGAQLTRFRKDGTILWHQNYLETSAGKPFLFSHFELTDNDRNIFLSGTTITSSTERDIFVAKMDTAGNMLWRKEYSIPGTKNNCTALCKTYNGFAIGIQYTLPSSSINWGTCGMAEFDTSGTLLWASKYQFSNSLSLTTIAQQSDSTFILGGSIPNPLDTIRPRAVLMGVDHNGQFLWTHSFSDSVYGNNGAQGIYSLTVLAQGDFFMTGGGQRIPVGRLTSQGYGMCNPIWYTPQTTFINPPAPILLYHSVGPDSLLIDTPMVSLSPLNYQQYISCTNIITSASYTEHHPDPWTAVSDVQTNSWIIHGPNEQHAEIEIFDLTGKSVYHSGITDGHLISASGFPGGMYLYTIRTAQREESSGKLVAY